MHVVIFAGGTLKPGKAFYQVIASADLIIAADSGAATALQYGCVPAIVVGDFDSLDTDLLRQLREKGSQVRQAAVEKNETDTELAVQTAIEQGATSITLLGALSGERFDHTMANILLLADIETLPAQIVHGPSPSRLLPAPSNPFTHRQPPTSL